MREVEVKSVELESLLSKLDLLPKSEESWDIVDLKRAREVALSSKAQIADLQKLLVFFLKYDCQITSEGLTRGSRGISIYVRTIVAADSVPTLYRAALTFTEETFKQSRRPLYFLLNLFQQLEDVIKEATSLASSVPEKEDVKES